MSIIFIRLSTIVNFFYERTITYKIVGLLESFSLDSCKTCCVILIGAKNHGQDKLPEGSIKVLSP